MNVDPFGAVEAINRAHRDAQAAAQPPVAVRGPRACQFCGSRHLACAPVEPSESQPAGYWRVECLYCHGAGPQGLGAAEGWAAWNGDVHRAPAGFGSIQHGL